MLLSEIKHTCCRAQGTYYLHCDDEERKHHTLTVTKVFCVNVLGVDYLWAWIQLRLKTRRHRALILSTCTIYATRQQRREIIQDWQVLVEMSLSAARNLNKISDDAAFLDIFFQFKKYFMSVILILTIIIQMKRMSSKQRVKRVKYTAVFFNYLFVQ